jgi:hypothetical protein
LIERQRIEREEAERLAREEAAMLGTAPAELPPVEEPPPVVVIPTVERPAEILAPVPKSAVRQITRKVLVIDDESAVPLSISGKLLRPVDRKAVEALLRAGVVVPGCRLESETNIGSAGSR